MQNRLRQLTIQRVLLVTLFTLIFVIATRVPVDTDTWWHLRSGETTLESGMIRSDPFSHTMQGERWINHSWAAQIVMVGAYELAGDVGLALYTAILATIGLAFIYPILTGNAYLRAFVLILAAITASVFWSARPQMISFAFSGLTLYLLYRHKHGDRLRERVPPAWLLPPLMLVWGNMHAGFSIGFIFLGGVLAGEIIALVLGQVKDRASSRQTIRTFILVGLLSVAALVVNPYGLDMLRVPFETVSIGALRQYIQEWQSPDFQQTQTWPFIFMLIALIGSYGVIRQRIQATDFVLAAGTLFMALLYGRNIAVFAVAAAPALSLGLDALLRENRLDFTPRKSVSPQQGRLNAALISLILFAAIANAASVLNADTVAKFQRRTLPVEAADFIAETQPPGPMFNSYNWGGYLLWALPDYPVYVDGRTDLYRSDFLLRWLDTALGLGQWQNVLEEDGINLVIIEQRSGLDWRLRDAPDWTRVYPPAASDDNRVVIYLRDTPLANP